MENKIKEKIAELTPEQKAKMPEYVAKWIKIGNDTTRLNYDRTLDIIQNVQRHILNKEPTPVIIFNNPMEAWVACNYAAQGHTINELKKCVEDFFNGKKPKWKISQYVSPYLNGSFSAPTFAFYDFFKYELGIVLEATGTPADNAAKNGSTLSVDELYEIWKTTTELGLIYPIHGVTGTVQDMCIVSEKPSLVKLNDAGVIHCDGGPAVVYEGYGDIKIFALNGVTVPEWLAVTPSQKIPVERIHEIKNADVKAEFVRKIGIERMLEMGKKLDSHESYNDEWYTKSEYELWDMHSLFPNVDYAPHLKMLNQTTKIWHVEAVSPSCKTIEDALEDRYGRNVEIVGVA
jgi:hypothetical protein